MIVPIRRALISVSEKRGIQDFAQALRRFDVEILSTGGTARLLQDAGLSVRMVSDYTGFPEMFDGRVKTLHPRIHGGLLALRDRPDHLDQARQHGVALIDLVVVNLYPFEQTVAHEGVSLADAVEMIDIGGPSMIRSAAKNYPSVAVVTSPDQYAPVAEELLASNGGLSLETRARLAVEAFRRTAHYDTMITAYLERALKL